MYDEGDVGLVDAHAEGVGRDHDVRAVVLKERLILTPVIVRHAGVIFYGGVPGFLEGVADLVDCGARGAVDYARIPAAFADEGQELRAFVLGTEHIEKEVGPVKACDEDLRGVQAEQPDYVVPDLGSGRGGEGGDDRAFGQPVYKGGDAQIARPEVLAPLGDAVGLIDGNEGYFSVLDEFEKVRSLEPFRGNVQEFAGTGFYAVLYVFHLVVGERAVEGECGHAG